MEKETMTINGKEVDCNTILYYDGELETVVPSNNVVLLCYDRLPDSQKNVTDGEKFEEWFYIQCTADEFSDYMESKKDLLSIMKHNEVFLWERPFKTFYDVDTNDLKKIEDLTLFALPEPNVYVKDLTH